MTNSVAINGLGRIGGQRLSWSLEEPRSNWWL
jgi:hypothetical protein